MDFRFSYTDRYVIIDAQTGDWIESHFTRHTACLVVKQMNDVDFCRKFWTTNIKLSDHGTMKRQFEVIQVGQLEIRIFCRRFRK